MKKVLIIAGSDSGAGAGIQADLRTLAALGVYGTTAVTAVTAQNTAGVRAIEEVSPAMVGSQIDCVLEDIGADVVKTGMLPGSGTIQVVADRLRRHGAVPVVVDPVMVSASGHPLLRPEAACVLTAELLPLAHLATPNLHEAAALWGSPVRTVDDMKAAALHIEALGARAVLVTGGHLEGDPIDVLLADGVFTLYRARRVDGDFSHGTGCTYASAIAAFLALGEDLRRAVGSAKVFITDAISHGARMGRGSGQPDQLHGLMRSHAEATVDVE